MQDDDQFIRLWLLLGRRISVSSDRVGGRAGAGAGACLRLKQPLAAGIGRP